MGDNPKCVVWQLHCNVETVDVTVYPDNVWNNITLQMLQQLGDRELRK